MPKLTPAQMKAAIEEFKKRFTPGYYHGSPSNKIKAFDPAHNPSLDASWKKETNATFLTKDPSFANSFLPEGRLGDPYRTGSTVYPVSANLGKHFDHETPEGQAAIKEYLSQLYPITPNLSNKQLKAVMSDRADEFNALKRGAWNAVETPAFQDFLRKNKYDSFATVEAGRKNVGIFEPQNIRGKFAEFNPEEAANPDFMKAEGGLVHLAGGGVPEKVVKAYKLFRTKKNDPETLYPLFVNANKPVPINEWVTAEVGPVAASGKVKSKLGELAYRPGWHAGDLPIATHIGGKSQPGLKAPDYRRPGEVWAEVEMPADVNWQDIANQRARLNKAGKIIPSTAHITDEIPLGGHYRYKTSPNMEGNWLIGGEMKVNRVLTDEEVQAINEAAGRADLPRFVPFDEKAEGGPVQHFQLGGLAKLGNPALKLAKEISPKFSLETIQNMPVSSAQKQLPVARAFQMLSSENVDPKVKQQIFKQYLQTHPDLVRKSGATNYDELTQAAYQQMAKETAGQFQALQGSGVKLSFDPTGEKAYKSSKEMLEDALQNKRLTVFQGGEPHPALGKEGNEQFRAVHDYFGHGTTGASFGPKGEELAYGAHSQMYSPLARLAAATETRGQNSLVSYSGMNEELINAMNQLKAQREQLMKSGGDPSAINDQLLKLGQQFKYAPQKPLILPPEQIDINYQGFAAGGAAKKVLEHARSLPFVHFSGSPSISQLDPRMYGKGIKGAEADRLKEALDIKPRSYFYVDKPGVKPEQGLGPHKYQGTAEGIYPLHEDPLGLSAIAKQKSLDPYLMSQGISQVDEKQQLNELERLIKQAGYKGYANDDVGLLFYPTPVKKAAE